MVEEEPLFARSPMGGKKSSILSIRTTDEHKFDLDRRAHELGMSTSELCEKILLVAIYGLDSVVASESVRTAKAAGLVHKALTHLNGTHDVMGPSSTTGETQ